METNAVQHILKENKLSITEPRVRILQVFKNATGALSHADIEKAMQPELDRVTIYRTLQSFVEKGLIHIIPTDDNSIRYATCKGDCHGGHHQDNHVHFICEKCGKTFCLDQVHVPNVSLPPHFLGRDVEMIVKGTCEHCQEV